MFILSWLTTAEQVEIAKSKGPEELLSWEDVQKMKYSRNVVNEVLRLEPPSQGAFKHAISDFTYGNFSIPKGWKVFSIYIISCVLFMVVARKYYVVHKLSRKL